ncbi:organic cation/carnitine transporter4 [Artemisia annua]|uniref:Organic cation/carnitine transporter4 n=1 Tax=Artemisia annua TaxID=35608 RepID=A0A2U1NLT2_ARTAN|nr:organic cation/carnitine transporter4 [Artemisia annua]
MSHNTNALDDLQSPLLPPVKNHTANGHALWLERLSIDQMLTKYCGEFGIWQFKHLVLTSMAWALDAFHTMVMIFADREPSWTCNHGCQCVWDSDKSVCGLQLSTWQWDDGQGWSTVAEWGLVCGQKYKVGLVQAMFFCGSMIGAGVFGHLSDSKLGRKGSLTIVCILNAIFGLLTSISPNYWTYVLFRLLTGFSTGGVGVCAFVLATEPIGPTKRGIAGLSTLYFFSFGIALLSGIAYIFQTWRSLYIASSVPSILFLVFILPFISESPRWYLVRGKTKLAMKIMHDIAKSNGKQIPKNVYVVVDEDARNIDHKDMETETKGTIMWSVIDVIKSPLMRTRLFLLMGVDFTCSFVYYGLSLNVVNLNTNLYLNVLLNAVAEMPAYFLTSILIDRIGRKPLGIGTLWFSGIFCIIGSIMVSQGIWKTLSMVCGVLGIFGMAGTYNLLYIYAMELFPTVVRNAALGCATQVAQLGAILVPFVVVMDGGFPFMVFGACGIIGGVLVFYLPETLNKPLYDTMNGMDDEQNELLA